MGKLLGNLVDGYNIGESFPALLGQGGVNFHRKACLESNLSLKTSESIAMPRVGMDIISNTLNYQTLTYSVLCRWCTYGVWCGAFG